MLPEPFVPLSLIGSAAFALSGYVVGVRKGLDIMGVFIVAMLTANGGGALRDVLLGQTPSVLRDVWAFWLVCGVLVCAAGWQRYEGANFAEHSWFVISDSIGLVAFAMTGALMALEAKLSCFGVMVIAFITATGGGIIRDMLVGDMPTLLKSDIYGSIALMVAAGLYGLGLVDLLSTHSLIAVFIVAMAVRLTAHYRRWRLPRIGA